MDKKYIGITGRKRHGKDTLGSLIQKYDPEFKIFHFADALKGMAKALWKLSEEQVNGSLKEEKFEYPIIMDVYLYDMQVITDLPQITPQKLLATTPRELLQYFGTNYVRSVCHSYWVDRTVQDMLKCNKAAICDVRFVSEAKKIHDIGGIVIKAVRYNVPIPENEHISEKDVDNISADYAFYFNENDFTTHDFVAKNLVIK